jgi:hypothetical protein
MLSSATLILRTADRNRFNVALILRVHLASPAVAIVYVREALRAPKAQNSPTNPFRKSRLKAKCGSLATYFCK